MHAPANKTFRNEYEHAEELSGFAADDVPEIFTLDWLPILSAWREIVRRRRIEARVSCYAFDEFVILRAVEFQAKIGLWTDALSSVHSSAELRLLPLFVLGRSGYIRFLAPHLRSA